MITVEGSHTRQEDEARYFRRINVIYTVTKTSCMGCSVTSCDGWGITVHASIKRHDFVTVGDILDALGTILPGALGDGFSAKPACACGTY